MKKIIVGFGTRPEIIKLAPLITALKNADFNVITLHTGQHNELATEMLNLFDVEPDYNLKAMRNNQDLFDLSAFLLPELKKVYLSENPDAIIVQGDTISTYLSALAGFYLKIPVFHVEAGLRSHDIYNPFPEEVNRKQISVIASAHFVPTQLSKDNLLKEGYSDNHIWITGNTVVDALFNIMASDVYKKTDGIKFNTPKNILLTSHRRENRGMPLKRIMLAMLKILDQHHDLSIHFPAHPSPAVQEIVTDGNFKHNRLHILPPIGYIPFLKLMNQVDLVLTDSGGIQEECAALGKKVLVLRETTERQELIQSGFTKLLGSDTDLIYKTTLDWLENDESTNPLHIYGNGDASTKIARILKDYL